MSCKHSRNDETTKKIEISTINSPGMVSIVEQIEATYWHSAWHPSQVCGIYFTEFPWSLQYRKWLQPNTLGTEMFY